MRDDGHLRGAARRARRGPIWDRRKQDPAVAAEVEKLATQVEGEVDRARAFAGLRSVDTAIRELRRKDLNEVRKGQIAAGLVASYRAGNRAAGEALVAQYAPLVASVCRRFKASSLPPDELKAIGRAGLLDAITSAPGAVSPKIVGKTLQSWVYNAVRRQARDEERFRSRHKPAVEVARARCPDAPSALSESQALELLQDCASSRHADPVQTHLASTVMAELTHEEQDLLVAVKLLGESLASYSARKHPDMPASQRAALVKRLSEQLDSILERIRASASDDGFDD